MINTKTFFFGLISTLFLIGCSDSSPSNPDREDLSSSSTTLSSSSNNNSSSSIDNTLPDGAKRASLEDLSKNMYLGTLLGADAYMAVGLNGLFSFWFYAEGEVAQEKSHGWIIVQTDFKDGFININKDVAVPAFDNSSVGKEIQEFVNGSVQLSFIVKKDSSLYYSVDNGEYVKVTAVQLIANPGYVTKASALENNKITCTTGVDSSFSVEFFSDGRFVRKNIVGNNSSWSAGLYDIHRSILFLTPNYYLGPTNSLYTFKVEASTLNLDSLSCTKESFETVIWDKQDIAKAWVAQDSLNWILTLNETGSFTLTADRQSVKKENKEGSWDQFGSYLALRVNTCLDPKTCSAATIGNVTDLGDLSFTYTHSDKTKPLIPTDWDLAELDE